MAQAGKDVETLNSFLRGEISAVETYRQAMGHIEHDVRRRTLEECLKDHEQRVEALKERIRQLDGEPAEGSGVWGIFAKVVQGGADLLGEDKAISALEEGEDKGLRDYEQNAGKVHGDLRRFVRMELLPKQKSTHKKLSHLKHTLH
ncbi:PA2169 family four-helix-bundle protein [Myxococcus sp. K38C18041901]|uniref:DUF2383 domain-containing protein n=1 Tax=Myxococcus guangdongensis TaxID=2906760 RepID=UPI0020A82283|nr:DUF2383 domain-containing protein [Myxococcus guangdongensis]MCP3060405.1 PA2169 family four-helix-bundle protein [Myxococcus guangdongensis]